MRLDAAKEALDQLDIRRRDISFDAHVEGGESKKALDKFNKDRVLKIAEIENIEIAVLEASRRVADAERAEELAEDAVKASRAFEIAAGLLARARKLDDALAAMVEEANDFRADLRILSHELGCSHPNESQLQSLGERAVKSALMFSPFRIEHIAPTERRTFSELCESWVTMINRWAEDRLPGKEAAD
jgi:hypothetical protein